jgi:pyridoxal phosphate enzyme (YggS family)
LYHSILGSGGFKTARKIMIAGNIQKIQTQINEASNGRNIRLVAVSKTFPPELIVEAYEAGIHVFGENRIQEALPKIAKLADLNIEWHFIGHLQTNKAREAVRHFTWIQSIDSLKLLHQVEKEAAKLKKRIHALLELNLGNEESKYGLSDADVGEVLQAAEGLEWVQVHGFMIIPPFYDNPEKVRPFFRKLRELRDKWGSEHPELTELSMGMSHDFVVAIEEGATMVRIGSNIFGSRK